MIQNLTRPYSNTPWKWSKEKKPRQPKSSVSLDEAAFYERLGYLLSASITLLDSLKIMQNFDIVSELEKGEKFSLILKKKKTNQFIISRISQGEKTGTLDIACSDIAQTLNKQKEIQGKILMSLFYPSVLVCATAGIIVFLVMYIFPKMMPLFKGMKVTLPITTRTVIWLSTFLGNYWWVVLLVLILFISFIYLFRKRLEFILFYIPFIKNWYVSQKVSRQFSRIGSYIESGIGLDTACKETYISENSIIYRNALYKIYKEVEQGTSFGYALTKHKIYPEEIHSMIMVGEVSGKLGDMCKNVGELYDKKFSNYTKTISTSVEPIAMLGMGLVVGFVALSMITPLYSITQNVH